VWGEDEASAADSTVQHLITTQHSQCAHHQHCQLSSLQVTELHARLYLRGEVIVSNPLWQILTSKIFSTISAYQYYMFFSPKAFCDTEKLLKRRLRPWKLTTLRKSHSRLRRGHLSPSHTPHFSDPLRNVFWLQATLITITQLIRSFTAVANLPVWMCIDVNSRSGQLVLGHDTDLPALS